MIGVELRQLVLIVGALEEVRISFLFLIKLFTLLKQSLLYTALLHIVFQTDIVLAI